MLFKETTGEGKDVVVIHGWSCDHRHMRPIVDLLSPHYRVTNVDLPGMGQSDWGDSIESIADIANILLPHLPEKAVYVAWSFGGLVAASIAARYPERVERLVGISTTPKFVEEDGWPGVPQPGFKASFSEVKRVGLKAFLKSMYDMEFASFEPKPDTYHYLLGLLEDIDEDKAEALLKGIDICDETDLRKAFAKINCPIDLIYGDKDSVVPVAAYALMKALSKNVALHPIVNAQHLVFYTHSKIFSETLSKILSV
jgi:pimeloyl-[acyl-carrier protein] methyl ester esterase